MMSQNRAVGMGRAGIANKFPSNFQGTAQQQALQGQHLSGLKNEVDAGYEDLSAEGAAEKERPKWMKKDQVKVPKSVKRNRMNARIRRYVQPKNAVLALNELKANVPYSFMPSTATNQQFFQVNAEVDGQTFTGHGISKRSAKNMAAENALKAILVQKIAENKAKLNEADDVTMEDSEPLEPAGAKVPPGEELDAEGKPVGGHAPLAEDDATWSCLASFALYKLLNDVQSPTDQPTLVKAHQPAKIQNPAPKVNLVARKIIPDNPSQHHPAMLLNELHPDAVFEEVSVQLLPTPVFTMSVTVDGNVFLGSGQKKKDAKKEASKTAMQALYNVRYDN